MKEKEIGCSMLERGLFSVVGDSEMCLNVRTRIRLPGSEETKGKGEARNYEKQCNFVPRNICFLLSERA